MRNLKNTGRLIAFTTIGMFGCATASPPQDLISARSAYKRASEGPAAQLDPADLHGAKMQLDVAEATFKEKGDTQATRDQAYLAVRKAELAEVVARTHQSNKDKGEVVGEMRADQKATVASTSAELSRTKTELADQKSELAVQGVALDNERAKRVESDKRAAQAQIDLAKFATVKQEQRGMVITLSGSVLFASAKWELLPAAQVRLNDVAKALTAQDPLSTMVVEGHTDSQGEPAYNQTLSLRRAGSVRDYLVTRGVASDRITAQGYGPTRAVANNGSAEGRANNRRVEIVVAPAAVIN